MSLDNSPHKYRRWYYRYDNIAALVEITEQFPRPSQIYVGQCLMGIVEMYQDMMTRHTDFKSIGAEEIQSLYKSKKKLRWYDEIPELHRSLSNLAIMPNEVLMNINLRLGPLIQFLKNKPNMAVLHPDVINQALDRYLGMPHFLNQR